MNLLRLIKYWAPDPSIPNNLRISIAKMQIANRCGMAGVEVNNISNTGIRSNDDGSESVLFNVQLPDDVEYVGDDTDISDADGLNELSIKENYDY